MPRAAFRGRVGAFGGFDKISYPIASERAMNVRCLARGWSSGRNLLAERWSRTNVAGHDRTNASRPDEIRVLGLQPVPARPALIEAARPLRHDAFEAELARLGEHDRALGGERLVLK